MMNEYLNWQIFHKKILLNLAVYNTTVLNILKTFGQYALESNQRIKYEFKISGANWRAARKHKRKEEENSESTMYA